MRFSLSVPRAEFQQALKTLAKFVKPKQASEAVLALSDGVLTIDFPGGAALVPADGTWPGVVRIPGQFLLLLSKGVPTEDPLPVSVREGRLRIAGMSIACTVEEGNQRSIIPLPLDAPLHAILHVRQVHSDDEIAQSGLTRLVQQAEERRDKLILRATEVLEPVAVGADDLRAFVEECIRRKYTA
jgi:hypothetical protein